MRLLGIDLQKSQGQLAYVLSVARESVWSWDVRQDVVVHDHNWCDVLQLDEKYLQHGSDGFTALVHEADRERMREQLRKCLEGGGAHRSDTVARLGGDELVVILAELRASVDESIAVASGVAEKIRAALGEPYRLNPNDVAKDGSPEGSAIEHRCSASIGVTLFLGQQTSQDELLKQADAAMYRAKDAGRNRIQLDEPLPG